MFLLTKREGKGFTQEKYKEQILNRLLKEICKDKYKKKQSLGAFCVEEDYFVVKDRSRVHGKKDTIQNKGLCNKARVKCFIYLLD